MSKAKLIQAAYSFYRPHDRAATAWKNEVVNLATGEITEPPSMTKQSHVAECDINNILKQYSKTGQLRHISANAAQGRYMDLPDMSDYQVSMNMVLEAQAAFASLPSKVRSRFHNDPAEFLEFMGDSANQEEMISLGLATRKASETAPTGAVQEGATPPADASSKAP